MKRGGTFCKSLIVEKQEMLEEMEKSDIRQPPFHVIVFPPLTTPLSHREKCAPSNRECAGDEREGKGKERRKEESWRVSSESCNRPECRAAENECPNALCDIIISGILKYPTANALRVPWRERLRNVQMHLQHLSKIEMIKWNE